jgi:hypothetical protein
MATCTFVLSTSTQQVKHCPQLGRLS